MTEAQLLALRDLCKKYKVPFDSEAFVPRFDLPDGWVAGWIGHHIYVGCSPEGEINT